MSGWRFEWITEWDDAWGGAATATWRRLVDTSPHANAFHEPALAAAWADTIGPTLAAQPVIGMARHTSGVEAVLPWMVVRQRGRRAVRRVLEPIGQSLYGYHSPLVSAGAEHIDWTAFWSAARSAIPVTVDIARFRLVHPFFAPPPVGEVIGDDSPLLELDGVPDFEALLARMSRKKRAEVRRGLRDLDVEGPVAFERLTTVGTASRIYATEIVPAYRARWRARPEGCKLDIPGVEDFFRRVVTDGVAGGWGDVTRVTVNNIPIAWHVGLAHRSGLYWWLPTHDVARAALAPGRALLAMLIRDALGRGVPRVHLLTGGHPYKLNWRPTPLALRSVRWYGPGLRAMALRLYDALRRPSAAAPAHGGESDA